MMISGEDACTRTCGLKSVIIVGGFHHLLLLTGFGPLGIAAAIWLLAFSTVVGWHVATRAEGPPPIKSALLAGLPAVVIIVYLAGTDPTVTITLAAALRVNTGAAPRAAATACLRAIRAQPT